MRKAIALLGGFAAALTAGQLWAQAASTVWDGAYTEAQAERGHAAYAEACGACHGAGLEGVGEAKPLTGPEFVSSWDGLSLGELYDRTRTTMPIDRPGGLTREAYADILAYMLKFNGFPAGTTELSTRSEVLATVSFQALKPGARTASDAAADAQAVAADPNGAPNPYVSDTGFFKLPPGRTMGSSSAVAVDSRGHIWVVDRCGANSCADSPLDPIMEFDAKGRFVQAFGKGLLLFPHGLFIDARDHIWLTDGRNQPGKGAQVFEFDRSGKVLRTLGKAGVAVAGPDTFAEPNAVVVAKDGTIFVADGHTPGKDPARIVKFDASGKFLKTWGVRGPAPGQLEAPHSLALDSQGRLFVADRWNNRITIFDPDGKLIAVWPQFGRPSGVYIDARDTLYVADSESRTPEGYGHHPGWRRGIRIGSARTGAVTAFIPDTEPNPDKGATSGPEGIWADRNGVVYGAQVLQRSVVRYTRRP